MSKYCASCRKKLGLFGGYEFLGKEYCWKCYDSCHYKFDDRSTEDDFLLNTSSTQSQLEAHGDFLQKQRDGTLTPEERDQYDKKWV